MTKISYEYVKNEIEKAGYILISSEYVDAKTYLSYICPKHKNKGTLKITWNKFQQGSGCKSCAYEKNASNRRTSVSHIKEQMSKRNYTLLETEYVNNQTKMKYRCAKHPNDDLHITWGNFQKGKGCKKCAFEKISLNKTKSYEEVNNCFKDCNYELTSKVYINNVQHLSFICNIHRDKGEQLIKYDRLQQGSRCNYCTKEKIKKEKTLEYDFVFNLFDEKGLVLTTDYYTGNNQKLNYFCKNCPDIIQETSYVNVYNRTNCCPICYSESKVGELNPNWKGGVTPLQLHVRGKINPWKIDSAENYEYKCIVTGDENFIIHHLFSFAEILKETLEELNLPFKKEIGQYSDIEIKKIESACLVNHYKYGLGVPLSPEVHRQFHNLYGYGENTPEQFYEFMESKELNDNIRNVVA